MIKYVKAQCLKYNISVFINLLNLWRKMQK